MLEHSVLLESAPAAQFAFEEPVQLLLGLMPNLHSGALRNGAARRYAYSVCD